MSRGSYFAFYAKKKKNEIEDESHVLFRCSAYSCLRKDVNIIASIVQDTSNAISRVMATDDEE